MMMIHIRFNFSCIALALLTGVSQLAPAKASRPVVRPPTHASELGLATPILLSEALEQNRIGLDRETPARQTEILQQAREYIQVRRLKATNPGLKNWLERCESALGAKAAANPYCRYEQERESLAGSMRPADTSRAARKEIVEAIRSGDLSIVRGYEFADVLAALGSMGDAKSAFALAQKAAAYPGDSKACLASELTTALASKVEELFPDANAIETSKTLYQQSARCGANYASAAAAFRLGLLLAWQNQCKDVPELMDKTLHNIEGGHFYSRAMYWRYYCAEKNGDVKVAKETRDRLMREHPLSFQNLAVNGDESEFTNQVLKTTMPSVALRSVIRPDMNTTLRAAEALSKAGSPHLAAEMLDHSAADIATLEPEVRLYVASFLHNAGAPLEEFRVLSMLFQDSPRMMTKAAAKMYFPLAYIDIVQNKQKHIDPLLILSLIRQESAFNRLARSSVGARGLMQVMPATARAVASVRAANLYIPEINVSVGSKYFAHQLTSFEGDVEYTLAAYNAGVNRVENWRKRYPTENKRLFLDLIPFRETRDYVTSILRNYFWYVRIYSDEITPSRVAAAAQATTGDVAGQLRLKTQAIMAANAGPVALSLERTAVRK